MRLIDADALMKYCSNQKTKTISNNDIARFPTAQVEDVQGEWKLDPNGMDWNIPAWRCSECGFVANYIGVEVNGLGNNPMNWAGSNFCPNCGIRMKGGDDK